MPQSLSRPVVACAVFACAAAVLFAFAWQPYENSADRTGTDTHIRAASPPPVQAARRAAPQTDADKARLADFYASANDDDSPEADIPSTSNDASPAMPAPDTPLIGGGAPAGTQPIGPVAAPPIE